MSTTRTPGSTAAQPPRWGRVLRVAAARGFLAVVASLMLWAVAPVLLGWQPQLIMTGSMMPRIAPGDVVVIRTVDPTTLTPGQVVTVDDPDHAGRTRTHRITRIDDEGRLVLRGDANAADDSSPVSLDSVHGAGALRVPYVGRPLLWLRSGEHLPLGAFLLTFAWSVATTLRGLSDDKPGAAPAGARASAPRVAGRRRRRVVVGVAGVLVGVFATGAAPADAAWLQASDNPNSSFTAAASFLSYRDGVIADTPYLYWRLEESSGTAVADSSGNGRAATLHGTPTFGAAGALASDPTSTAFQLTSQRFTQNTSVSAPGVFSIEAWIRTSTTSGGRIMGFGNRNGSQNSTSTDRHLYVGTDGRLHFGVGTTTKKVVSSTATVNDNAWHHVVATYSGSGTNGMKLYVDGALVGQNTGSVVNLTGYWRAGGDVMSGWTANPTTNWYAGALDEAAVYTTALSAAQVSAHYGRAS